MEKCCVCRNNISTIVKTECARVVCKEVDKAVYDDIAWTCGWVVCIALHDDMFSCLDFSFATQAADGEVREESLSILPMGAWPVVMRVKRVQSKLVKPIEGSHEPPLAYVSLITFWFSSSKSRKSCPLLGFDIKESCHSERMLSHSFFLLNKCDSLLGKMGAHLSAFTWSFTSLCLGHLALLGQNQN